MTTSSQTKTNSIEEFTGPYRFLSNFWKCPVQYEGVVYPSLENAYQAAKWAFPELRFIFARYTPGGAKKAGRAIELRSDWEDVKVGIMLELLRAKFANPLMRAALLETGDAELIEGNWWGDVYWGVYFGQGQNMLGKLLMQVREELRA